jgi:hypothetical protein
MSSVTESTLIGRSLPDFGTVSWQSLSIRTTEVVMVAVAS